ncbi:MAG: hypothetical protein IPN69_19370 [Acidobacteria bacterium]|nr:hypothetical protein [Acidobacteriota bacterium]
MMNFTLGATRKSTKETGEHIGDDDEELQNIGNLGILNIKADPEPLETEWVEPDTAFSSVTIAFNGLQDARNQLVGTLGNGECASKLDAVLSNLKLSDENLKKALGVQNSLRAKSILDLFDAIAGQKRGGFSFDLDETGFAALVDKIDPGTEFPAGGGGSTHASYDKGSNFLINAFIYVGVYPRTFTECTPRRIQQARRALLGILIHELLHAAGTNRYFDHVEMDAAAKIVDPSVSGLERLVAKYCEVGTYVEKFDNR